MQNGGSETSGEGFFRVLPEYEATTEATVEDDLLIDDLVKEDAMRFRSLGLAAQAADESEKSCLWLRRELRAWLKLAIDARELDDDNDYATCILEFLRCSEALADEITKVVVSEDLAEDRRKEAVDEIVLIHERAARYGATVVHAEHVVLAGARVKWGDALMVKALTRRAPAESEVMETESDESRLLAAARKRERIGCVAAAREQYARAIVSYRVNAAVTTRLLESQVDDSLKSLCGNGLQESNERVSDPGKTAGQHQNRPSQNLPKMQSTVWSSRWLAMEDDPYKEFGGHVAHCLVNMALGYRLAEDDDHAHATSTLVADVYHRFCDEYDTTSGIDGVITRPGGVTEFVNGVVADLPYVSIFATARSETTEFSLSASGYAKAMGSLETKRGGDRTSRGHHTWIPTILDIDDVLSDPDSTMVERVFSQTIAAVPEFVQCFSQPPSDERAASPKWLAMLREHPLLPLIGFINELPEATVIVATPLSQTLIDRLLTRSFTFYDHLDLWLDMTPREVAKCHGNDWERCPRQVHLPLLHAIQAGNLAATALLLNLGASPTACSPHDMASALSVAVDAGNLQMVRVLLHHSKVALDWSPPHELCAHRPVVNDIAQVTRVAISDAKARVFHHPRKTFASVDFSRFVLDYVLAQPRRDFAAFWEVYKTSILASTNNLPDPSSVVIALLDVLLSTPQAVPEVLQVCIASSLMHTLHSVITHLPSKQISDVAASTNNLGLIQHLVQAGRLDATTTHGGRAIVSYHFERENTSILTFLNEAGCISKANLTPEETVVLARLKR